MRRRFEYPLLFSVVGAGLASIASARTEFELRNTSRRDETDSGEACDKTTVESKKRDIRNFIEGPFDEEMESMVKKPKLSTSIDISKCIGPQ